MIIITIITKSDLPWLVVSRYVVVRLGLVQTPSLDHCSGHLLLHLHHHHHLHYQLQQMKTQ